MPKILILAKDRNLIQTLQSGLTGKGFVCTVASSPENALEQVVRVEPDLLLLEVKDENPHFILSELDKKRLRTRLPVLALATADKIGETDILSALDDFVLLPFNQPELLLRIRRLLKKGRKEPSMERIEAGNMLIDLANCEVLIDDHPVELTFKEYELLRFLAGNKGRVFSREALLDKIWGYDYFGGDRTVDVHIRRLRSKIENPENTFIETVRNIGYRFKKSV